MRRLWQEPPRVPKEEMIMAEKITLTITDHRRAMLTSVEEGKVEYARISGHWLLDGERQTGWSARTLSELNRAGLIQRTATKSGRKAAPSVDREAATLTKTGRAALTTG
jgi:hypothetical protein